jgi:hypothetical protein
MPFVAGWRVDDDEFRIFAVIEGLMRQYVEGVRQIQ